MMKAAPKNLIPQFVLAHLTHHMATGVLIPILPLLREGFGLNYFQSGVLVSAYSVSYGIGQIPMAMSFRMATMESLITDVVPVGRRTTVLGFYFFLGQEMAGISTPIVGKFIDIYGLYPVFKTLAFGLCVFAIITPFIIHRLCR